MRDFTVIRRRPNYIDILTPKRAGVAGYRFKAATAFNGSYTTILTAPIGSGHLDPKVNPGMVSAVNATDQIRIVFDPNSFTAGAGIVDTKQFWLRYFPVDFSGSEGTGGAQCLILTDGERLGNNRILFSGTAPQGAAVANSVQIDLPFSGRDFYIKNENAAAGNALYLATQFGGSEVQISAQEVFRASTGAVSSLFVRGSGGTAAFSASFSSYLPL